MKHCLVDLYKDCSSYCPGVKIAIIFLLQVDGKSNSKIQSLFIENFPVFCAHFTQDGEQIVIGSRHKSFKYFDMISGKVVNVPLKGRYFYNVFVQLDGSFCTN